jgi:AcrR family transcriptional regulator
VRGAETPAAAANLEPQTAKGRATREAILRADEDVFGEQSYYRASISEITRRAGVAQGTFYLYFPDKQAAFVELVHLLNQNLRREIRTAIADLEDRIEMERVGLQTFFDYMADHRALNRIVRESEFVAPDAYRWHYTSFARGYVEGLEEAQRKGQITDAISPETMTWILVGIAEFAGSHWEFWGGGPPPPDVFDEMMTFVGRALRPGREQ